MDFFNQTGKMVLGSRLRRLSEQITENALQVYKLYDIDFQPKWFPVFYVLSKGQEKTITDIAEEIGHSQPSVSKIISEMVKVGLILETKDKKDGRKNMVSLSAEGIAITEKIEHQYLDVTSAIEETFAQTTHDLWKAIEEWEYLLNQKTLLRRVQEQKKIRESKDVQLVDYEAKYLNAFRSLNIEWIAQYFKMEEADYKALDNPKEYILEKGGHILVALYKNEPVGVCALIKMDDHEYDYELAKMAVSPTVQGKNIGFLLGQAIIEKAKFLGASKIYLESNTILKPAINLYQKLGFQKVVGHSTPYERCNIQMGLSLNN
ncbi:bifunctional helix-turn-helix transcriptional regulator/GNAT family N-acetyltransferase [Arcicella sp. LKC2W]|uniref:bifunctional helix-turn-helix transcriptional regulator/GNAT family N-acetyltransferase n=1 Tax=Arcicella sp. LKC2W TaxID=2984198 RepID=UPI002B21290A|nr:bifunctional helix-turn-helix transcriptional regulator/GNAT family N-acetyltransferase [Arcicella sp. LKC2W]MEA5459573.1 bifunctional helix-turn-helix transcriptional regulator/GNAT family N-acetyltransferase [Arcicella sp. LKC2W]